MMRKEKELYEINEMSWEYETYLKVNNVPPSEARYCAIGLRALYWQAGEQMDNLLHFIEEERKDGFTFRMMVGCAYSILESLETMADSAKIGEEKDGGYVILSDTHYIHTQKTFNNGISSEESSDWNYFKFLRSFICAHPLETTNANTVRNYIPGDYAYCKVVDYIANSPIHFGKPEGADYYVQALEDGTHWLDVDFYINSNEIWQYVTNRFDQLVDVIHSTMCSRIRESKEKLINTPVPSIPLEVSIDSLDQLIGEDWKRGGYFHGELMICKFLLIKTIAKTMWDPNYVNAIKQTIWHNIKLIAGSLQKMQFDNTTPFRDQLYELLKKVGCDHNQRNNFCDLLFDSHLFGIDCDAYEEYGKDNYEESDCQITISEQERKKLYEKAKTIQKSHPEITPINIVSHFYRSTELPRQEIARLYFVIVLPDFVKKHDLMERICKMDSVDLYLYIIASMVLDNSSMKE